MSPLNSTSHYERSLERDIELIRSKVQEMSSRCVTALENALQALTEHDRTRAYSVILRDQAIDELEKSVDRLCLEFLVRQQPVALHLRFVYATIKINLELERIGDYAESIARQVLKLSSMGVKVDYTRMHELAGISVKMLKDATAAFLQQDTDLARRAMQPEETTDNLKSAINADLVELLQKQAIPVKGLTSLMTVARRYERVADQAKNICEEVLYMCTGEYMKHRDGEVFRILFVDQGNSCRSLMAEAVANSLNLPGFIFASAGLEPRALDPRTVQFLKEKGIDVARQSPKSILQVPNLDHYQVIVALTRQAQQVFPLPPTKTVGLDWTVDDPSRQSGTYEEVRAGYEATFSFIETHVRELAEALLGNQPTP